MSQAQLQAQNVQPQFEVEQLEGKVEHTTTFLREGELQTEVHEEDAGYMVYFPQGHSIRIKNFAELKRLGLHTAPGLLDMDSGEEIAPSTRRSLKSQVESNTNLSKKSRKEN